MNIDFKDFIAHAEEEMRQCEERLEVARARTDRAAEYIRDLLREMEAKPKEKGQ